MPGDSWGPAHLVGQPGRAAALITTRMRSLRSRVGRKVVLPGTHVGAKHLAGEMFQSCGDLHAIRSAGGFQEMHQKRALIEQFVG